MLMKVQSVCTGIRGLTVSGQMLARCTPYRHCVALSASGICTKPSVHEPVTLTLLEDGRTRPSARRASRSCSNSLETGIESVLPSPDSSAAKAAFVGRVTPTGALVLTLRIDVIWPRSNEQFHRSQAIFCQQIPFNFRIAANYTVDNKLVAIPYLPTSALFIAPTFCDVWIS